MDFSEYTVCELKEILRKLNLKTSGLKVELMARLAEVDDEVVRAVSLGIQASNTHADNGDDAGDAVSESNVVAELRDLVEQLSTEVRVLRASVAVCASAESTIATRVSCLPTVTTAQPCASSTLPANQNTSYKTLSSTAQPCAPISALPGQQNIVYTSQPITTPTIQPYAPVSALPVYQNAVWVTQPIMMTMTQPCAPTWTMSSQQNATYIPQPYLMYGSGAHTTTTRSNEQTTQNVYSPTPVQRCATSTQSTSHHYSLKDVSSILPTFDPADETYTSTQFVERIEQLKQAYAWDDAIVIFAVLSKLKGVAKRWADAQPVFSDWGSFVAAFLTDFPYVRNVASAHIALMNAVMSRGEKVVEYYYRMLALGRRENIDDASIIRYVINGLCDENLKRTLSAMQFRQCSELLRSIQNVTDAGYSKNIVYKRSFDMPVEPRKEKENNIPAKKAFDVNKQNNNNSGIVCFKCRQRGHIAKNCTQIRKISNKTESATSEENEAEINAVNSTKPHELLKDVILCTNKMIVCKALIDSGSGKSLIKRSIAVESNSKFLKCCEKLIGFAGGEIISRQKICVQIKLDDVTKQAEFLVVDDNMMSHDVLVGLDILAKATVLIKNGICTIMSIKNTGVVMGTGLEQQVVDKFSEMVEEYEGCFGEELHELGKSKHFRMGISLTSVKPVCKKPYNIPIPKRKVVEEMVTKLLELEIIRPSTSLYASPIVLVRKQNGEDRMCIDYRQLNAITEKQPWSMPTVDGVLSSLSGHRYFTTLDLMSGYYQIELEEECKHLTAFVTHHGHFEFNRMPFGLRNAPCTFQRMMSKLIEPMGDKIVSYVDEIIIATSTAEENLNVLDEFLTIVRNEGLTLRISKCSFLQSSVTFLGHIVDASGIQPGVEKINDVFKFPVPTNEHEVRRFLGLTGFFRKFVANYAHIAKSLTNLLKKDVPFIWSNECDEAFRTLIRALTSSPVLAIYDVNKQHQLHTDASSVGVAAILMQENEDGKLNAVAYYSRCCNNAERNYHAYELEVLAVVEACERFRMYLLGKPFAVVTDCQSISTAKLTKPMLPRVARWLLKLQEYDCQVIHRAGESMKHVDAMSRAPKQHEFVEDTDTKVTTIETQDWVSTMQQADDKLRYIRKVLTEKIQCEQRKQIEMKFAIKNHRLFYKMSNSTLALVVPKGMRWRIVKLHHDDIGHPALETVIKRISTSFWFPRMRNFIKSYIKSCIECAYHKEPSRKACELYGMDVPSLPFQVMHLDHLGPFIKSKRGYEYVLVCVDALTRYVVIYPTRTTHTKPVVEALNQLTLYFGLPKTIITDRGTAFTSSMFSNYCENNNVQHIKVAVRTPRSNGLAERVNQNILTYLKTATTDPRDWDSHLRMLQWTQNTKPNATTKFAPLDLIFDFPLRDISGNKLIAAIQDDVSVQMNTRRVEAAKQIESARAKWKKRFDAKHAKPFVYNEGDLVLIESPMQSTGESRKLQPKYKGPYVVTKVLRYDRYVVEDLIGNQRTKRKYSSVSSSDKMKPWCALFPEIDDENDDQQSDDESNSGRV